MKDFVWNDMSQIRRGRHETETGQNGITRAHDFGRELGTVFLLVIYQAKDAEKGNVQRRCQKDECNHARTEINVHAQHTIHGHKAIQYCGNTTAAATATTAQCGNAVLGHGQWQHGHLE